MKDVTWVKWSDSYYKGQAVTVGAGVQGYKILAAGKAEGFVTVGGECSTVGLAGGCSQGGGHSALSTSFGLGADNILSMQVVTAGGKLLTASRTEEPDLYRALSGGGDGTYGVVTSMTVKACMFLALLSQVSQLTQLRSRCHCGRRKTDLLLVHHEYW